MARSACGALVLAAGIGLALLAQACSSALMFGTQHLLAAIYMAGISERSPLWAKAPPRRTAPPDPVAMRA
jgi:hypothetical protein